MKRPHREPRGESLKDEHSLILQLHSLSCLF